MKINADIIPPLVEGHLYMGNMQWTVNHSVVELELGYEYESVTLPVAAWDYGMLVSNIIRSWYDDDKMQAIINNYLLEPDDDKAFRDMQHDRIRAKIIAIEAMLYGYDEGIIEPEDFEREYWAEKLEELKKLL